MNNVWLAAVAHVSYKTLNGQLHGQQDAAARRQAGEAVRSRLGLGCVSD